MDLQEKLAAAKKKFGLLAAEVLKGNRQAAAQADAAWFEVQKILAEINDDGRDADER